MSFRENAFPVTEQGFNRTSGTFGASVFLCVADGNLEIEWKSDTPNTTRAFTAQSAYDFSLSGDVETVTIISGTFDIA